jgi:hypothetical protein
LRLAHLVRQQCVASVQLLGALGLRRAREVERKHRYVEQARDAHAVLHREHILHTERRMLLRWYRQTKKK